MYSSPPRQIPLQLIARGSALAAASRQRAARCPAAPAGSLAMTAFSKDAVFDRRPTSGRGSLARRDVSENADPEARNGPDDAADQLSANQMISGVTDDLRDLHDRLNL